MKTILVDRRAFVRHLISIYCRGLVQDVVFYAAFGAAARVRETQGQGVSVT
ncbi:MAG: hypothetical protein GTO46_06640 [Gemmatimonadetes bacterium]|nr:hypothetical protein [Gemmatimonadota bacterium]NIO31307.1 hypothetical protein [Gemmatimonadota bacterium]